MDAESSTPGVRWVSVGCPGDSLCRGTQTSSTPSRVCSHPEGRAWASPVSGKNSNLQWADPCHGSVHNAVSNHHSQGQT